MEFLERHLFSVLLWVSTALSVGAHAASGEGRVRPALLLVAGLAFWIHGVHRVHAWGDEERRGRRSVLATLGLQLGFALLVAVDASYLFMLFGVFSFTFGFVTGPRRAAVLSGLLTVIWIGAWVFHGLPTGAVATPVFVWGVANAINLLSDRISRQNDERGELIERLRLTRRQLALAERERGVLEERSRLAREIHDTLAQGFTSIVLVSDATNGQIETIPTERVSQSLDLISKTARENLQEARRLIAAQTPLRLEGRSLDAALRSVAEDLESRSGALVDVAAPQDLSLGAAVDVALLRVAQEACANIAKHAGASKVTIALRAAAGEAALTITDDGAGIEETSADRTSQSALSGGSGLGFMAERLEALGGTVTIESSPGGGTTVHAALPVDGNPA